MTAHAVQLAHIEGKLVPLEERDRVEAGRLSLRERMAHYRIPGASIAVLDGGAVAWARGYGICNAGATAPVVPETRFQAASISKPVAALAALRLVERKVLSLDADVNEYLTGWQIPEIEGWQPRVTLRQLLSHTAGLTVHGFPGYPSDAPLPTLVQILGGAPPANTPRVGVDTVPGAQFRYSGGGYCVVQQLLADVTRQSFPVLMRELVLEPLGMAHSGYDQPPPVPLHAGAAHGHWGDGTAVRGGWRVYPELAAAGLWTAPTDLLRFAQGILRAAAGEHGAILSPEMAVQLLTPQLVMEVQPGSVGLGLMLEGTGAGTRFGHGGDNAGFKCHLVAFRSGGFGAAVMTNGDNGSRLTQEILYAVAEAYDWPAFREEQRISPVVAPETLASYVGTYHARPGFAFVVSCRDDTLFIAPTGQEPFAVSPRSPTTFAMWLFDSIFTFAAGALIVTQNGREIVARRT